MERKKIFAFFVLFAAGAYCAFAQPKIRPDHPRIFFNSDTWKEVAARADGPAAAAKAKLLRDVDSRLL